ncbi:MAG: hypothetical protein MUP69_08730 [Candidatus Atribacteria bacterium]|nr:hypothetical protein [Candidatus Atribacteria bacterium]
MIDELMALRFGLFALAWIHKFVSDKIIVAQSAFTKCYLHEKGKDDIWSGMEHCNEIIDGATLNWLSSLGKISLSLNYNMRKDLTAKNIETTKELSIEVNESAERANNRLWSENARKQKLLLASPMFTFCNKLYFDTNELKEEA